MKRKTIFHTACLISLCWGTLFFSACQKSTATYVSPPGPPVVSAPPAKKWIVSTLAGSGAAGFLDGDSTQAQFSNAQGITCDNQGNLFVGDLGNASIREISPAGHVTTYAGKNIGNPDPAFGNIYSVVADSLDNLYTVEYSLIRKLPPGGNSFVFAGNLSVDYIDATGTNAAFNILGNMTIDRHGTIFLPDYDMSNKFHLRKVTPAGVVSTLSLQDNTGFPSDGLPNYYYLYAIANDSSGNLYITANGNSMIKKIDPLGNVSVLAGSTVGLVDGKGSAALFSTILGMACDASGNLWVTDGDNHTIRKVTPDGTVTTIAGNGTPGFADGDSTKALFRFPFGITVDKKGIVYVMDNGNNRVRKLEYK